MKIEKLEHMSDIQLIMYALSFDFLDSKLGDELIKRATELRQNLPLEEHKKYYGGKDG